MIGRTVILGRVLPARVLADFIYIRKDLEGSYMAGCNHDTSRSLKVIHTERNQGSRSHSLEEPDGDLQGNEGIGSEYSKPVRVMARIVTNDHALRGDLRTLGLDIFCQSLRRLNDRQRVHTGESSGHPTP